MTSVLQRQKLLGLIRQACANGARLSVACRQIGLSCRTVQHHPALTFIGIPVTMPESAVTFTRIRTQVKGLSGGKSSTS